MKRPPVYLTSDVHLGAIRDENEAAFLSWLEEAGARAETVFLNGDLFDYWFEYGTVIPQGYTRALGALAAVEEFLDQVQGPLFIQVDHQPRQLL
jgi:UDP-2,3-diacylglucosamine hydrolase